MSVTVTTTRDLAACHALRRTVFIEEQGVPADLEVDGRDGEAVHLLATDDGTPVGTARFLVVGDAAKIGRVCVLPDRRGEGIGVALIRAAMAEAKAMGLSRATLGAQVSAIGFYDRLGYTAEGEEFMDAGIPHRTMSAPL